MSREFELKYAASHDTLAAIHARYPQAHAITMETVYYDTPENTLSSHHRTLRRRLENGVSVCTLKLPLGDGSRAEYEVNCPDILTAIPLLIAKGAPEELAQWVQPGLVPTCGARFTRYAQPITVGDSVMELALDEGVLLGGGKELPFWEVEVELKSGQDVAVHAFARTLAAQFSLVPQPASKLKRARELAGL